MLVGGGFLRRLGFIRVFLDGGQVDIAAGQRALIGLPLMGGLDLLQPELVDRVVEQQNLDAFGQRLLELRAGAQAPRGFRR